MDVFAFPSRLEGSPNAVLEAMATGLPIVATSIGGVVDLLDRGRAGLLVPPDDPAALAEALDQLILDPNLRSDLGSRARRRTIEFFSLANNVSRLIYLYLSLQNGRVLCASDAAAIHGS
jgi:glycosyltransferase involved in cell wall biosynthesis